MDTLYIAQSVWGNWYASGVLRLEAFPSPLSRQLFPLLLSVLEINNVSAEIICQSHETQVGSVSVLLVIRKTGPDPRQVSQELTSAVDSLVLQLRHAGIQTSLFPSRDCYGVAQNIRRKEHRMLCFPGEKLNLLESGYVPGGIEHMLPLDISALFSILAASRNAGISLLLTPTRLYPQEAEMISGMITGMRETSFGAMNPQAEQVYASLLAQNGQPLFFLCLSLWGEEVAMNEMLLQMRHLGFSAVDYLADLWEKADYLCQGGEIIANFAASKAHVLPDGMMIPRGGHRLNHLATPNQVAALLMGRPMIDAPVGISINRVHPSSAVLPPELSEADGIFIGKTTGEQEKTVGILQDRFCKHAVVVGMPGTGKTTFSFGLLHSLYTHGIPFLAIEPTKTEYREMLDVIPDLQIYTPGRAEIAPLMFNPFLPPAGITLEQYLPSLETAFTTAFSMTRPLDVIFPEVLRTCYTRYGWRMNSTRESPQAKPFGMLEFIRVFRDEIDHSGYDPESKANLQSGGVYRFQSLLNSNSVLFDTDQPLPTNDLLNKPTLIELDAIDNVEQKTLILSLLLIQLKLVIRRDQAADGKLKNVIMIDEAHLLLGQPSKHTESSEADPVGRAAAFLQDMVLVNRAYGTGMIFADQSPYKLTKDIVSNADIQMIFRLNNADDRRMLAENMNMPPELVNTIDALTVGQCYLHCAGLDTPVLVITPNVRKNMNLRSRVEDREVRQHMKNAKQMPFNACKCGGECCIETRQEAEYIARKFCDQAREYYTDREALDSFLRVNLQKAVDSAAAGNPNEKALRSCAKMMIMRRIISKASCISISHTS